MKRHIITILLNLLVLTSMKGQHCVRFELPNQEQLSSERVLQVLQDAEGFLWYATEGGGVCRDDGRQMVVFRSDAEHPDLLGSNDVACLAEAAGRYILIGTFHGAYVLDKQDYAIRRLMEVDDKRVDDIIVTANGHWWMTANKKVYEYADDGRLLKRYPTGDKYLARLHEDRQGRIWASQWDGGLIKLDGEKFVPAPWPLDAAPTAIDDDSLTNALLIGTIGKGVVRYQPESGTIELTEPKDSICMSRVTLDLQGRCLVADGQGNCFVLSGSGEQRSWFEGVIFTRNIADSVRTARNLSTRPTAIAVSEAGDLWFSTGKDIRLMRQGEETVVLSDTKDVSAMTFTEDGTLWLATIFGTVMTYKDGQLAIDEYASNEYGDAVTHLEVDSRGRLLLVSDRYVRLYDPVRHTLRQQSREAAGVYSIELEETTSGNRWSQPQADPVVERMPQWVWWILAALFLMLSALIGYIWFLRGQRKRFLAVMTKEVTVQEQPADSPPADEQPDFSDEWLQSAIAQVEAHLSEETYSVEQLSSDLCMSRMTFYRKIQSATGQKPTEFMRTIRLRRAAELLHEGRLTISEISVDTGFSSVSYFSRCFRTMYGVPPTQFGKATTADDRLPSENPN
ncbi:MAG: helix-turn-helix domain-containing protein [Bacteroidaceae bacterium]|nr:helix-turn-helix domain-containing protein [Bacteroidaceae bacterium]